MNEKMKFCDKTSNGVINPREAWEREAWSVERSKVKNSEARKFQLTPLSGIAADKNDPARPFSRFTLQRFSCIVLNTMKRYWVSAFLAGLVLVCTANRTFRPRCSARGTSDRATAR